MHFRCIPHCNESTLQLWKPSAHPSRLLRQPCLLHARARKEYRPEEWQEMDVSFGCGVPLEKEAVVGYKQR